METFLAKIGDFGYPELVAILLKLSDVGGDLKSRVKIFCFNVPTRFFYKQYFDLL